MNPTGLAAVFVGTLLLKPAEPPRSDPAACGLEHVKTVGELQSTLSRRAVEIVALASGASPDREARLAHLVASKATFALGSGDVGRPLDTGVPGAIGLAKMMNADSYRFYLWSYIPTPEANPCGKAEVKVEFINGQKENSYPVTFTFEAGRLLDAQGWTQWFASGPIGTPDEAPAR
jgi:hypothetical protein